MQSRSSVHWTLVSRLRTIPELRKPSDRRRRGNSENFTGFSNITGEWILIRHAAVTAFPPARSISASPSMPGWWSNRERATSSLCCSVQSLADIVVVTSFDRWRRTKSIVSERPGSNVSMKPPYRLVLMPRARDGICRESYVSVDAKGRPWNCLPIHDTCLRRGHRVIKSCQHSTLGRSEYQVRGASGSKLCLRYGNVNVTVCR